jgi:hypothetical protein
VINPSPQPDFDSLPHDVLDDLETRRESLPLARVSRYADYWALQGVERDHIRNLAKRFGLSEEDRCVIEAWWMNQLVVLLADTLDRLHGEIRDAVIGRRRSWILRIRFKPLFQLCYNTVGPGGRCWFGNRYTFIRHYTFRLHWRP